ncbi:MAG TPA: hypothetical protein VGE86_03555 [Thermoanaerobaculia bacterium]
MPSIVIRLDPELLDDPNLDLRYRIPDMIAARSSGLVAGDGYDYEEETDAMQIYLQAADLDAALPLVIAFLRTEHLFGNDLASAATVGISDADAVDTTEFRAVFPESASGVIRVP